MLPNTDSHSGKEMEKAYIQHLSQNPGCAEEAYILYHTCEDLHPTRVLRGNKYNAEVQHSREITGLHGLQESMKFWWVNWAATAHLQSPNKAEGTLTRSIVTWMKMSTFQVVTPGASDLSPQPPAFFFKEEEKRKKFTNTR